MSGPQDENLALGDELALNDDDSLPWLESEDYDDDGGIDTGGGPGNDAGQRRDAPLFGVLGGHQHGRGSAVVDSGGVACRYHTTLEEIAQASQRCQVSLRPGVFVSIDRQGCLLATLGHVYGNDFILEDARLMRGDPTGLRARRKSILIRAADVVVLGHVIRRLGHGIDAILRLHLWVHETPADGRIKNFCIA